MKTIQPVIKQDSLIDMIADPIFKCPIVHRRTKKEYYQRVHWLEDFIEKNRHLIHSHSEIIQSPDSETVMYESEIVYKEILPIKIYDVVEWLRTEYGFHISALPFRLTENIQTSIITWFSTIQNIGRSDVNFELTHESLRPSKLNYETIEEAYERGIVRVLVLIERKITKNNFENSK